MKVLIATDGSPGSMAAVETFKNRPFPADTIVKIISVYDPNTFHVFGRGLAKHDARAAVDAAIENLNKCPYSKSGEILQGNPFEEILQIINGWQPDMLFIGAVSHSRQHNPFLGKVTQAILERSECSVIVARSDAEGSPCPENKYLLCIDSAVVIGTDSWISKRCHYWSKRGHFFVLSIVEPIADQGSENPKRDAQMFLETLDKKHSEIDNLVESQVAYLKKQFPKSEVQGKVIKGIDVVQTILKVAQLWKPDLIAMNSHHREGIDKFLINSVSQEVAKNALCSVELIR